MPQSNEVKKEQARLRMQKMRNKKKEGVTQSSKDVTQDVTQEMVPPLGILPERPRFKTLSDGQVLDRSNPPKGKALDYEVKAWEAANRMQKPVIGEYGLIPSLADPGRRGKLQAIAGSLKSHSVLDKVNYGINGPAFTQVGEMLDALH